MQKAVILLVASFLSWNAISSELTGKKLRYVYENGNVYEICFVSESELFWKAITGDEAGTSSRETFSAGMIEDRIHQVGWVEKTGFTVSQVINLKSMKIHSHLIFTEHPGEKPTLLPVAGKIEEIQKKDCIVSP